MSLWATPMFSLYGCCADTVVDWCWSMMGASDGSWSAGCSISERDDSDSIIIRPLGAAGGPSSWVTTVSSAS